KPTPARISGAVARRLGVERCSSGPFGVGDRAAARNWWTLNPSRASPTTISTALIAPWDSSTGRSQRSSSASSGRRMSVAATTITVYPPAKASRFRTVPPRSITPIAMTPPSTSIVTTASPKKARRPANVMPEGYEMPWWGHDGANPRRSRGFSRWSRGFPAGAGAPVGAAGLGTTPRRTRVPGQPSAACGRTSRRNLRQQRAPRRRARGHSGSRATKRGRMLHERRLTALDSSAPLLFIEAIPGSGKRAMPVAVAFLGGDEIDGADLDLLMRLLESGIRVIVASFDLSRVQELAGQRGICSTTLGDRETWLTLGEVRVLVRGQGVTLSEDAVDALYNATLGHPGMSLASLETMPVESAAGLVTRDRAL